MNHNHDDDGKFSDRKHTHHNDRYGVDDGEHEVAKKSGLGIGAIVLIIALALAAWFMFNNKDDTPSSAVQDGKAALGNVVDSVKDGAAEVPQAAKDATTDGDQKTTRPNDDNSKSKLDQK